MMNHIFMNYIKLSWYIINVKSGQVVSKIIHVVDFLY